MKSTAARGDQQRNGTTEAPAVRPAAAGTGAGTAGDAPAGRVRWELTIIAQWAALRAFVDTVTAAERAMPSSLAGWTVDDLLSHVAAAMDTLAAARPVRLPGDEASAAPSIDTATLSLADLLALRRRSADRIATDTRRTAAGSAANRAGEYDAAFGQALRTLSALGPDDAVVVADHRRVLLTDLLAAVTIELVVHAEDLARSLAGRTAPVVLPQARELAARALRAVVADRAGVLGADADLARLTDGDVIDIACGRRPPPGTVADAVVAELPVL